jgi:hypothetical protein
MAPGVIRSASRPLARAAVLVFAAMAWFSLGAGSASAAAPSEQAYWWRARNAMAPSLAPPFVPPDGLWVSADGDGQHAISAVRYKARSNEEIKTLVLTVSREVGQNIVLLGCPAAEPWAPVQGGAWRDRPDTACDVAFVTGVRNAAGTSWSFDVRGLARRGTLDLVIMPRPEVGSAFSLSFEKPGVTSVVTRSAFASPSPGGSTSSSAGRGPAVLGSEVRTALPTPGQASQQPTSSPFDFGAPNDPIEVTRNRLPFIGLAILLLIVPIMLWRRASRREPPGPPPPEDGSAQRPRGRVRRVRARATGVTARLSVGLRPRYS